MFKLVLKFQDAVLEEYTFEKTPVTIGRREDNDVVIDNMAVSGHHAIIEEEDPNYYVLADLESLNGTFVNEKKIAREKIFDNDTLIVGKHILSFIDLRPQDERPSREAEVAKDKPTFRETVILDTKAQQELLAKHAAEQGSTENSPERPKRIEFHGSLTLISGGTPQIIDLTKRLTTLGKSNEADVRCSGLLVGKTAALINKRPNGFFLAYAEGLKKPEVNGETITTQVQLQDGDEISIGGTRLTFNLREEVLN
ncbi:FHA domain-containing protein [Desulfomonile tiedjei]|uniref:FHA domain-containing protein n=1 Tax=Desulfomonile tiedjei (strain ATCC 49306 / DSM 6799 / DCB-1) TaxID=706587 RepID=I4C857_DESTA|nr:FHA domain-containing protein [Desulfomonile tiedjei]AFM25748.1 FHA domain-containing protein [Desulfomonile tiedjei DSM 6799]